MRVLGSLLLLALLGCDGERSSERPPPAPRFSSDDWLGGFEPGATGGALRAACESAGHAWNVLEPEDETPLVRGWFATARMARCSGLARGWAWGDALQVNFALFEDRLTGMTAYVDGDPSVVTAELERIAQASEPGPGGRTIYLVDRAASGYEPMSMSVSPPAIEGARFGLTYVSPNGMSAPPLPGAEEAAGAFLDREAREGRAIH